MSSPASTAWPPSGVDWYYHDAWTAIACGDCREIVPVLPSVGVLLTDPPYGVGYCPGHDSPWKDRPMAGDESTEVRDWVLEGLAGLPAAVFGKWSVPAWGTPKGVLVWDKGPSSGMGDLRFPWKASWEQIAIYGDGWSGRRDEGVLRGPCMVSWSQRGRGRRHPTEKPVWLLARLLAKAPDGIVLDPFMGAGSTLRAAKDLCRRSIGVEIEERYCETAARCMAKEVFDWDSQPRED